MPRFVALAVLLALGLTSATLRAAESKNAATWYAKAVEKMGALSEAEINAVLEIDWNDPHAQVSTDARLGLVRLQESFALAKRGGQQDYCDYQLDRSQGFELMLPHLNTSRKLAKLMRADAMLRLREGDATGAADRLASVYRMADHSAQDGIIISSLVGAAIFNSADHSVQGAIDRGEFAATDAAALLQAAKQLPADDPFEYVEGIVGEQEMMISWLGGLIDAEEDGGEKFAEVLEGFGVAAERQEEFAETTPDEFRAMLDQADALMNEVVGVFMLEDRALAQEEMARLSTEIEGGDHGLLATLLMPAYAKILENRFKAADMVAARVKSLEAIAKGQMTPEEAANAAVWYLRGIEMIEKLPRDQKEAIRALADEGGAAAEERARAALEATGPIIDVFREGSLKRRCDFTFARPQPESIIRAYVGGMREAARLLEADARRAQAGSDAAAFVDPESIALRMSAHLAEDHAIVSSLTSHTMFERAAKLAIESEFGSRLLPEEKSILASAAETMSRKDPFGYVEALARDRELAKRWIVRLPAGPPPAGAEPATASPSAEEVVAAWDGDRLLHMLIVLEARMNSAPSSTPIASGDPMPSIPVAKGWLQLADVLALDAIQQALAPELTRPADHAASSQPALEGIPTLNLGRVEERRAAARSDLRLAVTILDPVAPKVSNP